MKILDWNTHGDFQAPALGERRNRKRIQAKPSVAAKIPESEYGVSGISLTMIQDFKFAFRQLIKTPGFTAIAVLTLAIAIGVNSAVFALVNGVILRPVVPLRPAEVVNVFTARQGAAHDYRSFSYNEFSTLQENNDVFADVAAMQFALAGIGREEGMRRSFVFLTSSNFFSLLGVKPVVGRFYDAAECRPDANISVVVASYPYWKKLGGRADLIGKPLTVNGRTYTLIGVTPDGFAGTNAVLAPDLWLPLGVYSQLGSAFSDTSGKMELTAPKNYTLNLVARMSPGLTIDSIKPRLPALAKRLTAVQPPDSTGTRELQIQAPSRFSISTQPSDDGPVGLIGILLLAMAGAVLLIACLNLANMLLARGANRSEGNRAPARARGKSLADCQATIVRGDFPRPPRRCARAIDQFLEQRSPYRIVRKSFRLNELFHRGSIAARRDGACGYFPDLPCRHASLQPWTGLEGFASRPGE